MFSQKLILIAPRRNRRLPLLVPIAAALLLTLSGAANGQPVGCDIEVEKFCSVQPDQSACTVVSGGDVTYTYVIINTGSTTLNNVSVVDDQLGEVPGSPIATLAPGGSVELMDLADNVTQDVTNTVVVVGTDNLGCVCTSEATATVTVVQAPAAPASSPAGLLGLALALLPATVLALRRRRLVG